MLTATLTLVSLVNGIDVGTWVNEKVQKSVTWSESNPELRIRVDQRNTGNVALKSSIIAFESSFAPKLGYIALKSGEEKLTVTPLGCEKGSCLWSFEFARPVEPNEVIRLDITAVISHVYKPYPETTSLMESNAVVLDIPLSYHSPYPTLLDSLNVSSIPQVMVYAPQDGKQVDTWIYWHRSNQQPFMRDRAIVHSKHSPPLAYFSSVKRVIEVSHWGSVAFTEHFNLHNEAAGLDGEFSRVPFTVMDQMKGNSPFKLDGVLTTVKAVLPRYTRNLHYFDVIGNVSTSTASRAGKSYISLDAHPRFPLVGGWRSDFQVSYDLPLKYLLEEISSGKFALSVNLNHPFVKVFADRVEFEVMLPEGASDVRVQGVGSAVRELSDVQVSTKLGWLDTPIIGGHTLVKFKIDGGFIIPEKDALNTKFKIFYSLNRFATYRPAILLCVYFFILFMINFGVKSFTGSNVTSTVSGFSSQATSAVVTPQTSRPVSPRAIADSAAEQLRNRNVKRRK